MSYPRLKPVGFLLLRPDSIPAHPQRRPRQMRPFQQSPCGRRVTEVSVSAGVTSACPMPSRITMEKRGDKNVRPNTTAEVWKFPMTY
ncbi:MAG: hypothetical protein H5T34_04005 [Candidatus Methanomethyliales bacterium]|nr:hypothetical protein [Candidatus Methanomethylicales archaeon]